ncbi:MAG: alpha/beta hydrolase [Deltaproteobacteria bacterium]|nr:alpha/beta hydrolase [Deltaproteobacteria bacterium]
MRRIPRVILVLWLAATFASLPSCGRMFRAKPMQSSDDVTVVNDIVYYDGKAADRGRHMLDLYLPKNAKNPPTLVLVHGGAWFTGNKRFLGPLAFALAQHGIAVATPNYRLTPRVKHPGHVTDVARAISWVKKNAGRYGADDKTIFLSGHSAGGHLVALVALDDKYLKKRGIDPDKDIAGVLPISGVYVINDPITEAAFTDDKSVWRDASPMAHIHRGAPPFLVLHAENEMQGKIPLVEQAEDFVSALRSKGVESDLVEINNSDHTTIVRDLNGPAADTLDALVEFIERHG